MRGINRNPDAVDRRRRLRTGFARGIATLWFLAMMQTGCAATATSPLAIGSNDEPMVGRYTGGSRHFGRGRKSSEGTWAIDYAGMDVMHAIDLRWHDDERYQQGGIGSY